MAPEILMLLKSNGVGGYSSAVDYWSLGITVYRLLTGKLAFSDDEVGTFLYAREPKCSADVDAYLTGNINASSTTVGVYDNRPPAYMAFMYKLTENTTLSPNAVDFVQRLLEIDEGRRLGGSSACDVREVKKHPFFSSIEWSALLQKSFQPPCIANNLMNTSVSKPELRGETDAHFTSALRLLPRHVMNSSDGILKHHASFEGMLVKLSKDARRSVHERDNKRLAHLRQLVNHPVFAANVYDIGLGLKKYFNSW